MRIDPEARSSIWKDLITGVPVPLNRRIVELVHEAELDGSGTPDFNPEELCSKLSANG